MTRGSRAICALHTLTALWLAWLTVNTWGHAPLWVSVLNVAASLMSVMAIVREHDLADERHTVAALREREGRRAARRDELAEAIAVAELEEACCERWWTSLATDHDPTCENQQPRSNAA